jgi:hypothetical protein
MIAVLKAWIRNADAPGWALSKKSLGRFGRARALRSLHARSL